MIPDMERIELNRMRYFLVVAEMLHFGTAAKKVGLAQSDLIFQIREIEKAIGYPLFLRNSEQTYLTLTPAGSYLRTSLEDLQTSFDEAILTSRLIGKGKKVQLTIGFTSSAMYTRVPLALDRFRTTSPETEIELREIRDHEHTTLLQEGKLDAAFIRDGPETYGLGIVPVVREPFHALLPSSHALAVEETPLQPQDLKDQKLILLSPRNAWLTFERTMSIFRSKDLTPEIAIEAQDWVSATCLVAAGMGVSIVPASVAQFKIPGAVFRPLHSEARSYIDLWTLDGVRNPAITHLQQIVASVCQ
jgi:DNA-binding transcriptional LysR family regulator